MLFGSGSEVWIGTWEGAYRLDLSIGTTIAYTTENGLLHNNTTGFADDSLGNFYIATRFGFHILEPGKALRAYHQINNAWPIDVHSRSEEHTSELQSLMRISYAVFCLKKKNTKIKIHKQH